MLARQGTNTADPVVSSTLEGGRLAVRTLFPVWYLWVAVTILVYFLPPLVGNHPAGLGLLLLRGAVTLWGLVTAVNALVTILPADPVTHHRLWTADHQLMLLALVASVVGVILTAVPLLRR